MFDNVQKICRRFSDGHTSMSWLIVGGKGLGKRELVQAIGEQLLGKQGITSGFKFLECGLTEEAKKRIQKEILDGRVVEDIDDEDKKTEITVEDVRGAINFLSLKTTLPCKILVVYLAEQMNINAQNALLKTLEEPFEKTLIFLLSENPSKLLPTILSRCQKVYLHPMKQNELLKYIQNKYPEEKNAEWVAGICEGLPGIADEICDYDGLTLYKRLNRFFVPVQKLNVSNVLDFTQEIAKDMHQYHLTTFFILKFLRDQSLRASPAFASKISRLYTGVESVIRKADSLYLDKSQVLSDIIFKIAEQFK